MSLNLVLYLLSILFFLSFYGLQAQTNQKDSLLFIYHKIKNKSLSLSSLEQINLYDNLAKQYRFRDPDSLLLFAEKINEVAVSKNSLKGKALAKTRKGEYYSDIGENKRAIESYLEAEPTFDKIGNPNLTIDLKIQLTIEYYFTGQLKEALVTAYDGLTFSERNELVKSEARLRHILGFIYTQNKLYTEAENELEQAISLWKKSNDSINLYAARSNMARNSVLKGDLHKAKRYFQGNLNFFKRSNETLWLARSYMVQSHIHKENNEWTKALESNKKYDSLLQSIKNPRDKILTFNLFSELYIQEGAYSRAKTYADSTLIYANRLKDSFELMNGYRNLKNIAIAQEDYDNAIKYSDLLIPIKEVLDRKSGEDNLKLARAKLELEYQILEKEIQDNKKILVQKRIASIMLLLLVVVLGLVLFIRKIAQNRKKTNEELKKLNATKNRLFSILGHDLKSPINTLQELLNLHSNGDKTAKDISKLLPKLKQGVDNSSFTLNNLLVWARTQMNGLNTNPEPIAIKKRTDQICNEYRFRIEQKTIEITCNIPKDLKVLVDQIQLEVVLRNIILNAIKFTPKGGKIMFNAKVIERTAEISICDSGVGMDDSQINYILTDDLDEANMDTRGEKGSGLGLQLTKALIELNNGQLRIDSEIGIGSCFYVLLPLIPSS